MALFFTATLGVSIVAMVLMLSVKRYELNRGRMLFVSIRPSLTLFSRRLTFIVARALPALLMYWVESLWRWLVSLLHRLVAQGALFVEYTLEKVLHVVREKTTSERPVGEASAFLREVADHKRMLLKRSKSNRIILDE